jgi:hypothetical protein
MRLTRALYSDSDAGEEHLDVLFFSFIDISSAVVVGKYKTHYYLRFYLVSPTKDTVIVLLKTKKPWLDR